MPMSPFLEMVMAPPFPLVDCCMYFKASSVASCAVAPKDIDEH